MTLRFGQGREQGSKIRRGGSGLVPSTRKYGTEMTLCLCSRSKSGMRMCSPLHVQHARALSLIAEEWVPCLSARVCGTRDPREGDRKVVALLLILMMFESRAGIHSAAPEKSGLMLKCTKIRRSEMSRKLRSSFVGHASAKFF